MMKKVLLGLGLGLAAFLVFVATRPDRYRVQRSQSVEAPVQVVYSQLDDLRKWAAWSPWDKLDPKMTKTYEGPERGVGASYSWQGNKDVGKGKMTVISAKPAQEVRYELEFIEPFASVAETSMSLRSEGNASRVTWAMEGKNDFMGKLFGVFMDMDTMIGKDFERGLSQLKEVAERQAQQQGAAPTPSTASGEPQQPAAAAPSP